MPFSGRQRRAFAAIATIVLVVWLLSPSDPYRGHDDDRLHDSRENAASLAPPGSDGSSVDILLGEREILNDVEIVWQLFPKPDKPLQQQVVDDASRLRGVVALFHGCTHDATHWFLLPEERGIVRRALMQRFAVIAVSSQEAMIPETGRCWDGSWPPEANADVGRVLTVLKTWTEREGLRALPLFAIGASSGGSFATVFARAAKLAGMFVQISPGIEPALTTTLEQAPALQPLPPSAFLYMSRDTQWATQEAAEAAAELVRASGAEARVLRSEPLPLGVYTLSDRIDGFPRSVSRLFWEALLEGQTTGRATRKEFLSKPAAGLSASFASDTDPDARRWLLRDPRTEQLAADVMVNVVQPRLRNRVQDEFTKLGLHSRLRARFMRGLDGEFRKETRPVPPQHDLLLTGGVVTHSDVEAIGEVLNVLWGQHELTREHADAVLLWWAGMVDRARPLPAGAAVAEDAADSART